MEKAVYFIFLLCGILSQGICSLSEENNAEKSADIHIRKRRIAGGKKHDRDAALYLVHLLDNGNAHCPATLLTNDVAITSAQCCKTRHRPKLSIEFYATTGPRVSKVQKVIFLDPNYNTSHPTVKNLALLRFSPGINFSVSLNRPITIFSGNLAIQNLEVNVFTWGRPFLNGIRKVPSTHLRSLAVRIISIQYCQEFYRGLIGIGNLCAYAANVGEHCDDSDSGSPLVVEGDLLGITVYHGPVTHPSPDVFMNLLDHDIRRWIHKHVPSLHLF